MKTIYCHGLPGSYREISSLVDTANPDLLIIGPNDVEALTAQINAGAIQVAHIIGFSLGAMTAMELAAQHPQLAQKLTLIAPAAPLELGDFLPHMAGRAVFRTAMWGPTALRVLTFLQNLAVKVAPKTVIQTMFNGSPPADLALLEDPDFQACLTHSLKYTFGENSKPTAERICLYVQPWACLLASIQCPVTIHHGEADNWTPLTMSHALVQALPAPVKLIVHPKLGHYSTLHNALPSILKTP